MDAAGVDAAVLVSLSCGGSWSVHVAAGHPDRVLGLFAIAPSCGFDIPLVPRTATRGTSRLDHTRGWAKYNRYHWLEGGYDEFLRFFFTEMFSEPHSTKQIEDAVAWGREVGPQTLVDTTAGRLGCDGAVCASIEELCARVTCPVVVLHGTDDRIRPLAYGERLAELTGGTLVRIEGAGHGPPSRDPVLVNREIMEFVRRFRPAGSPVPEQCSARDAPGRSGSSTSRRRSVWATPRVTSPSPGSCAGAVRTSRSTGWRRIP